MGRGNIMNVCRMPHGLRILSPKTRDTMPCCHRRRSSALAGQPRSIVGLSCQAPLSPMTRSSLNPNPCSRRRRSAALAGQYRNIMNVCRVLPNGTAAKQAVDEAIDLCTPIGAS